MAGDDIDEGGSRSWGRLASGAAVVATLLLIALMTMVTLSNSDRERALALERHSYDVMLLTRTADATIARAEAALGRYVLDEEQRTGSIYYSEWRLAERQIEELRRLVHLDVNQRARVQDLENLYRARGAELAGAAAAARAKRGSGGISLFYQAGMTERGPDLRAKLAEIAAAEREDLRRRMAVTGTSGEQADRLAEWLGWIAVLIGLGAIAVGMAAFRAIRERLEALGEADTEAHRALALEQAVQERTHALVEANEKLRTEGQEREAAEARLRQVQKMEAVGQLTGGIAHDFNNMLAVVLGGIDLARRKLSGSKRDVEFHLDSAMEGALRAATLTRRLLAFARAEPLLAVGVAPAELVENMLDLVDRSIGERISVRTHFPDEKWQVRIDTNQLESAILNLAVNARDAMDGEGQLDIAVDNVTLDRPQGELAPGDYVRISVSDSGSGISPENLERVFEPFFTTKPIGKGTGLGLSQIFGFTRQSGGDVVIQSEIGIGTTVTLYLPRSADAAAPVAEVINRRVDLPPAPESTFILVVEDDPRVSRATVSSLEELGHRPIACSSGREALDLLQREPGIELIITDVMMPEMTGPELIREAASLYPWIAVLFVTGFAGEAGEAKAIGGYDVLRKPFTVAALADAVATALSRVTELPPASARAAGG